MWSSPFLLPPLLFSALLFTIPLIYFPDVTDLNSKCSEKTQMLLKNTQNNDFFGAAPRGGRGNLSFFSNIWVFMNYLHFLSKPFLFSPSFSLLHIKTRMTSWCDSFLLYLISTMFLYHDLVDDALARVGCGIKGNILVRGPPCFGGTHVHATIDIQY